MADILPAYDNGAVTESLIMNIEKRDLKMFNTITIIVLAAVLLTIIIGISIQQQTMPSMGDGMRLSRGTNLFQPELAQTGPTGTLALNMGIILLLIGFGVIVLLLVRFNLLRHHPS